MPVPAQVRRGVGDDHQVAAPHGDLLVAAGAEVRLASLEGLDPPERGHLARHRVGGWFGIHPTIMVQRMETIGVERSKGVVTATLDRPHRKNAATPTTWRELRSLLSEVAADPADRVLVVTGAAGDFCSGADLSELRGSDEHSLVGMRNLSEAILALHRLPKPTIAKVRGVAVGAGCNLALACDLIVAAEDARFSEIFARRGLSLDGGGSWLLPRLVGLHRAKELAFLADILGAAQAAEMGLVNRVVRNDELDAAVDEWAARLASGPPLALAMTKAMLNESLGLSMEQAVEHEGWAQSANFSTADTAEAMRAFVEKREPRFSGR